MPSFGSTPTNVEVCHKVVNSSSITFVAGAPHPQHSFSTRCVTSMLGVDRVAARPVRWRASASPFVPRRHLLPTSAVDFRIEYPGESSCFRARSLRSFDHCDPSRVPNPHASVVATRDCPQRRRVAVAGILDPEWRTWLVHDHQRRPCSLPPFGAAHR
jgi:hypothetical protein